MKEIVYVNCNLCGNNDTERLYEVPECTDQSSEVYSLVRCKNCGLVYVNPRPIDELLHKYYPQESYYAYQKREESNTSFKDKLKNYLLEWGGGYRINSGDSNFSWKVILSKSIRKCTSFFLIGIVPWKKDAKLLDVGCGNGDFLMWHKNHGWDVYGVEINREASLICSEKGLKVFNGSLEHARFTDNFFDVVTLVQVLEHLTDPLNTIKEIVRIMKPGGLLLIGVPNFGCFDRKIFKENWIPLEVPRHLYHFELNPLIKLLMHQGLNIQEIRAKGFYLFGIKNLLKVSSHYNLSKWLRLLFKVVIFKPLLLIFTKNKIERFATFISVYCKKNENPL